MMRRRRWRRRTTTRTEDNKDYCCEVEKEGNEDKDMDVCMVPIGQYIIHYTRHVQYYNTDSNIIMNGRYTIIRTNVAPTHKTINSISQLYVYTSKNSVAIILGDQIDTDMTANSTRLTIHHHHCPTCQSLSFRCTHKHSYIQQSTTTTEEGEGE